MNYYRMRAVILDKLHTWIVEYQKEEGHADDFITLCRQLGLRLGAPRSMIEKMMRDYYGLAINEDDELVKI